VLGVLPYLHNLHIEAEDAIAHVPDKTITNGCRIIVPVLPHISNHTDFDALRMHPQVDLTFIRQGQVIPAADLIILPGTKNVRSDLKWLTTNGWQPAIQKHLRYGGKLMGICGGLQMLGTAIHDPMGIEGSTGSSEGLGFFNYQTTLEAHKQLQQVEGHFKTDESVTVTGYEIHAGITTGIDDRCALIQIPGSTQKRGRTDGILSSDKQIMATYLHGIFDHPRACKHLLNWAGLITNSNYDYRDLQEQGINLMADTLEAHLDIAAIMQIIENSYPA